MLQNVHFPKSTKSDFLQYGNGGSAYQNQGSSNIDANMASASNAGFIHPENTLTLVGEKGYRTALCSHGFTEGCYYFEVEMLNAQMPLPFSGVYPAIRVGFSCLDDQDLELPMGSHARSYAYTSSSGKAISNAKTSIKRINELFGRYSQPL